MKTSEVKIINNCTFFWHEYEDNGFLSNWFESPFVIDDFCYLHVEQYIMAQKAKLFHDAKEYTAILRATTPNDCKKYGRLVTPYDDNIWKNHRFAIMKTGLRAKFSQNTYLKKLLLQTGHTILAEASPYDAIFGINLDAAAASKITPSEWPGENLLGKALMEIRTEFGGANMLY